MEPPDPTNSANDDAAEVDEIASLFLEDPNPECWAAEAELVTLVCPLVTFRAWWMSQPEQMHQLIASDAARFLCHEALYQRLPTKLRCPVRRFKAWLRRPSKDCCHTLARVALLKQAIDLCVYRNRESHDDWVTLSEESVDRLLAVQAAGRTDMEAICREGLEALPERALAWMLSARSWRQLCASNLSEEALACWMEIASWQQD